MNFIFIILCAFTSRSANALANFELMQALTLPLNQRLQVFKANQSTAYPFLATVAFERKFPLQTRWRALTSMGRLDGKFFADILDRALQSHEWFMRNAALIAIQSGNRDRAVRWSAKLISDPALVVRTQAVRNLIGLNARETEPLLWKQIFASQNFRGTESLWVRVHMAEALARFASPGRAKYFQRLLLDRDDRLHSWAIVGLENTTGFKMGDHDVPLSVRRQEWLARLGVSEI